ncbi:MAG: cation:proton antiporter [Deltaproteobacteria bacterium]|nr:cation:proton antiporter [Deltaproteobacteria bacterium]
MPEANEFLSALAVVLGVAAVTTVLFRKLRQPVVLGYLLAGFIVGPNLPVPLVADPHLVHLLSELGVILLMFSIGLEFSLRKLLKIGGASFIIALLAASIMLLLGYSTGRLLGWTPRESVFAGAIVAISSTTIVIKAFNEGGIGGKLRELVVGVLVAQDLIAIVLMAALTALSTGAGLSAEQIVVTTAKLGAFLFALIAVGMLVVPRGVRAVTRLQQKETSLVASIGFCFAVALLAHRFGYSVALGAFIAGSLIAESGEGPGIEKLIEPVRDMFAAVFFVSVGMMIDPALIAEHWLAVLLLTLVVVVGQSSSIALGAFLTGHGIRPSVRAGMSLAQIGEFSFIIVGVGLSLKAVSSFLYPIAVAVSVVTTFSTPWLIRVSDPVANFVDRKLPPRLQTFAVLYGSWVDHLRKAPSQPRERSGLRRLLQLLVVDVALLAGVIIGFSLGRQRLAETIGTGLRLTDDVALWLVLAAVVALGGPLCFGIIRIARRLGVLLATSALPDAADGKVDLAAAPRRALVLTLQLAVVLIVGLPLLALTQPFIAGAQGVVVLMVLVVVLGVGFWRSTANLEGHVRAGVHVIVEALSRHAESGAAGGAALVDVHALLPGIGEPLSVRLADDSPAVGKTLADLNLRGMTGASVLAIVRSEVGAVVPSATETLRAGDVLALAGSHESVTAAQTLLAAVVVVVVSEPVVRAP